MFKKNTPSQSSQIQNDSLLSQQQLQQLKQSFSDISLNNKQNSRSINSTQNDSFEIDNYSSNLMQSLRKISSTIIEIHSRSFTKFVQFAGQLQIGKQISRRPQLYRLNMSINFAQMLSVAMAVFIPRKLVYKVLLTLFTLSIQIQIVQKYMLSYNVQKIALQNNQMTPVQQQARNIIEYRYRIHQNPSAKDPQIIRLLQEVDRKNMQYMKFKKISLLL